MLKTVNNKEYKRVPKRYSWECGGCVAEYDLELCESLAGRDWASCTPDKIYVEVEADENS